MALNKIPAVSKKRLPTLSPNLTVRITPEYRQWLERAALHSSDDRIRISRFRRCRLCETTDETRIGIQRSDQRARGGSTCGNIKIPA